MIGILTFAYAYLISGIDQPRGYIMQWLRGNVGVSLIEDIVVLAGLFGAIYHPAWFLVFLAAFVLAAAWVLPRIWRGARALWGRVLGTRRRPKAAPAAEGLPLAWNVRPLKD